MRDLKDFGSLDVTTSKLISATAFYGGNHHDIYWSENSSALLSAILTLLLVTEQEVTIWRVIDAVSEFFLQPAWSEKTEQRLTQFQSIVGRALPGLSPGIRSKLKFAAETMQGWKKLDPKVKTILRSCLGITVAPFLASSALPYWDTTKESRIDPTAALEGKIVVVSLPGATEPETAGLLCRLIKMEFYRAAQKRRSLGDHPLAGLVMDEYHLAVTRGSARWADATHLATLRGKGVFTIAATQGLGQLDQIIGSAAATDSILINFNNLIFMRSQEMGRLYALAERVLGHRAARINPMRGFDGGTDLMMSFPPWLIPPELVCPSGFLARLDTHQAFLLLANGYRTEEPVWLAPLYLPEPETTEAITVDQDLEALRRAEVRLPNETTSAAREFTHYSSSLWKFVVNASPRHAAAFSLMTLGEFRRSVRGLGRNPDGLETIPAAWRMAIFHLTRILSPMIRVVKLAAHDGRLEVEFGRWTDETKLAYLLKLETRWKRSVYPSVLRPLHATDRRWLEIQYPHLWSEIAVTRK